MKEFWVFRSKMRARMYLFGISAVMGGCVSFASWLVNGLDYSTVVSGTLFFLFFAAVLNLSFARAVYAFELTDSGLLRCSSLAGTSEYSVNEIVYLRLARKWDEAPKNYGIVEHSRGKATTYFLDESQSAKLSEFFQSVAKLNSKIEFREDPKP
jgi:hypothetical protein